VDGGGGGCRMSTEGYVLNHIRWVGRRKAKKKQERDGKGGAVQDDENFLLDRAEIAEAREKGGADFGGRRGKKNGYVEGGKGGRDLRRGG